MRSSAPPPYPSGMRPVRGGVLGTWDRVVGPGATRWENAATLAAGLAGGVLAPRLVRRTGPGPALGLGGRSLVRALALDLWGGAVCNNTPAAARWYGRPGQGDREHLVFAVAHLHPFIVAWVDRDRLRLPWWAWGSAHHGYLVLATALVRRVGHRRREAAVATTLIGVGLDRLLGAAPSAPWFAPVLYVKLLLGHAADAALLGQGRR